MIEVKQVCKTYDEGSKPLEALDHITCSIRDNEFVSFLGPSGCGKSTLLKIMGGLLSPTSGELLYGMGEGEDKKPSLSFVFQKPVLFPWRTVHQNIILPLELAHQVQRDPRHLIELVGLSDYEHLYPSELSGGMMQRVAMARALVFNPNILLMDEPFGALDEFTRLDLNIELQRIWSEIGFTCVFVTHSIAEAVFLSDRIFLLSDRPARMVEEIKIDFERPRTIELTEKESFQQIVGSIRRMMA